MAGSPSVSMHAPGRSGAERQAAAWRSGLQIERRAGHDLAIDLDSPDDALWMGLPILQSFRPGNMLLDLVAFGF